MIRVSAAAAAERAVAALLALGGPPEFIAQAFEPAAP
jgi:hypothetical protein